MIFSSLVTTVATPLKWVGPVFAAMVLCEFFYSPQMSDDRIHTSLHYLDRK